MKEEHTCNNFKWCPAGIGFAANSISDAVAMNEYVILCSLCTCCVCSGVQREKGQTFKVGVVFLQALGDDYFDLATQAAKNCGFPSFLLIKAMKAIEGCACLCVCGGFFMYLFASS